ncbi:MAG: 4Fe-4S binding protein [Candidatus Omnitrophica bacterium]|nr:4Fe-4S binding protein [Candidatus Omnitrophota bacterium]
MPPKVIFQADPLIMIFTSISERVILPGLIFILPFLLLTLIVGRFFCGWVCPLGTIIDGVGALSKVRKRHALLGDRANAKVRKFKYLVILVIATGSLLGVQLAWIFDPLVIAARFVSLNLIPAVTLAINRLFVFAIKNFDLYGGFYDFYRNLKGSLLGVKIYYFSNAALILLFFICIILSAVFVSRAWCRVACPLGAIYAFLSRFSLLSRVVYTCVRCRKCKSDCRMGAMNDDTDYVKSECILCMDCIYDCPQHTSRFVISPVSKKAIAQREEVPGSGITRREFLLLSASAFFLSFFKLERNLEYDASKGLLKSLLIRPPGAQDEARLMDRCIRCGNCMKVCPTNVLQPSAFGQGLEGLWTPHLSFEIGYCEYNCTLCTQVCPTGAISGLPVSVKQNTKLGVAEVDRKKCIAWADDKECIVCQEHCPVPEKAIKLIEDVVGDKRVYRPVVDKYLCIGCGICQNKCPVRPERAIQVLPLAALPDSR